MACSQPEGHPCRAASGRCASCSLQGTCDGSRGHCFTTDNPRGHSRDPSSPFSERFPSSTTWDPSQEERDQPQPTTAHHSWDLEELDVLASETEGKMVDVSYTRAVSFRPQGKAMFPWVQ